MDAQSYENTLNWFDEDTEILKEKLAEPSVDPRDNIADEVLEEQYYPPLVLNDMIDTYVDYLNILSAAVLLHREDLIPRIYSPMEDTDYDGSDAVIENLLSFFLPDRPKPGSWF